MISTDTDALNASLGRERDRLQRSSSPLLNSSSEHSYSRHRVIWQHEGVCLRVFTPDNRRHTRPLVLCYALVNRPWILDLAPGSSLIEALVKQGFSVYLIDWGNPQRCQRYLGLEQYIGQLMHACVEAASADANTRQVDLAGVCQGGVFSLCYAAMHPERVARLVTLVTPVDFHTPDFTLSQLYRGIDVTQLIRAYGNVPGALVTQVFSGLQPMRLGQLKHLGTAPRLTAKPEGVHLYMLMERWLSDCPDLAGRTLQQFVQLFFKDNALMLNKKIETEGLSLDLSQLSVPVLNIYGEHDHLVPPTAAKALQQLCGSCEYKALAIPAGHIGTLMGQQALKTVPAAIRNWLQAPD